MLEARGLDGDNIEDSDDIYDGDREPQLMAGGPMKKSTSQAVEPEKMASPTAGRPELQKVKS